MAYDMKEILNQYKKIGETMITVLQDMSNEDRQHFLDLFASYFALGMLTEQLELNPIEMMDLLNIKPADEKSTN